MHLSQSCCDDIEFYLFKHKTAYEMRISDWSSDLYSSDLPWPSRIAVRAGWSGSPGTPSSNAARSVHPSAGAIATRTASEVDGKMEAPFRQLCAISVPMPFGLLTTKPAVSRAYNSVLWSQPAGLIDAHLLNLSAISVP